MKSNVQQKNYLGLPIGKICSYGLRENILSWLVLASGLTTATTVIGLVSHSMNWLDGGKFSIFDSVSIFNFSLVYFAITYWVYGDIGLEILEWLAKKKIFFEGRHSSPVKESVFIEMTWLLLVWAKEIKSFTENSLQVLKEGREILKALESENEKRIDAEVRAVTEESLRKREQDKNQQFEQKTKELIDTNSALKFKYLNLKSELEKSRVSEAREKDLKIKAEKKIQQLKQENSNLVNQNNQVLKEIEALKTQHNQEVEKYEVKMEKALQKIEEAMIRVNDEEAQRKTFQEENENLKNRINDLLKNRDLKIYDGIRNLLWCLLFSYCQLVKQSDPKAKSTEKIINEFVGDLSKRVPLFGLSRNNLLNIIKKVTCEVDNLCDLRELHTSYDNSLHFKWGLQDRSGRGIRFSKNIEA